MKSVPQKMTTVNSVLAQIKPFNYVFKFRKRIKTAYYPVIQIDSILKMIGEFAGDSIVRCAGQFRIVTSLNFTRMRKPTKKYPHGSGAFTQHIRLKEVRYGRSWLDDPWRLIPDGRELAVRANGLKYNIPPWQIERSVELLQRVLTKDSWRPVRPLAMEHINICRKARNGLNNGMTDVPISPHFVSWSLREVDTESVHIIKKEEMRTLIKSLDRILNKYLADVSNYRLM